MTKVPRIVNNFNRDCIGTIVHAGVFIESRFMKIISRDKVSQISPYKCFSSFSFHYSVAVLFYFVTKVKNFKDFNFHRFASSVAIVKINRR